MFDLEIEPLKTMSSKYRASFPYYTTPETSNKNSLKTFINAGAISGLQVEHIQLPGRVRHLLYCPWVPLDGWWQENNGICCGINLGIVTNQCIQGTLQETFLKRCSQGTLVVREPYSPRWLLLNAKDHWDKLCTCHNQSWTLWETLLHQTHNQLLILLKSLDVYGYLLPMWHCSRLRGINLKGKYARVMWKPY